MKLHAWHFAFNSKRGTIKNFPACINLLVYALHDDIPFAPVLFFPTVIDNHLQIAIVMTVVWFWFQSMCSSLSSLSPLDYFWHLTHFSWSLTIESFPNKSKLINARHFKFEVSRSKKFKQCEMNIRNKK